MISPPLSVLGWIFEIVTSGPTERRHLPETQSVSVSHLSPSLLSLNVGFSQQQLAPFLQLPASESWFVVWKNASHFAVPQHHWEHASASMPPRFVKSVNGWRSWIWIPSKRSTTQDPRPSTLAHKYDRRNPQSTKRHRYPTPLNKSMVEREPPRIKIKGIGRERPWNCYERPSMLHEKNENIRRTIIVDNQSIQEEKETLLNFGRKHHSIQKNTSSSSIVVLPVEYSFFYYWYHLKYIIYPRSVSTTT